MVCVKWADTNPLQKGKSAKYKLGVQRGVCWGSIPLLFSRQCYNGKVMFSIYSHGIDILHRVGMGTFRAVEKSTAIFHSCILW